MALASPSRAASALLRRSAVKASRRPRANSRPRSGHQLTFGPPSRDLGL
jgi:hypothetical protein